MFPITVRAYVDLRRNEYAHVSIFNSEDINVSWSYPLQPRFSWDVDKTMFLSHKNRANTLFLFTLNSCCALMSFILASLHRPKLKICLPFC